MPDGKRWTIEDFLKPPVEPEEPKLPREGEGIPDMPYSVKDPYTGKDIDLVLKQGMFLWRKDKLEGFFTKKGDFITTRPEETEPWERTRAFFSNLWKGMPVNPYYWKSPQAKWRADRKDALLAWAEEANIENPEEYVGDLLAQETKELAWEAYEPEEEKLRIPELPVMPTEREKISVGERFTGEWVIPMTILSSLGLSAIKGRAALAAKPGVVPKVARGILYPAVKVEQAVAYPLELILNKPAQMIINRSIARDFHRYLVAQGIKVSPSTEKVLLNAFRNIPAPRASALFQEQIRASLVTQYGEKAVGTYFMNGYKLTPDVIRQVIAFAQAKGNKKLLKLAQKFLLQVERSGRAEAGVELLHEKFAVDFFKVFETAGAKITSETGYEIGKIALAEAQKYYPILYQAGVAVEAASSTTHTLVMETLLPPLMQMPPSLITAETIAALIPAGVALSITPGLITQLTDFGYTPEAISTMKPDEAWANLFRGAIPEIAPETVIPPIVKPTVQHLIEVGREEFDRLADTGRVAPFGGDVIEEQTTNELKAVAEGRKPIAYIAGMDAAEARKLGLVVKRVTMKGEKITDLVAAYAAYKKGNKVAFDKLNDVFTREATGELKGAQLHTELGTALGYSEADIAKYLREVYDSYEGFVEAAKLEKPVGVPQPKVKLTGSEKLRATSIGKLKPAQVKKLGVRATVSEVKALNKKIEKLPLRLKADARAVTKDFDVAFRQNKTLKKRAELRKLVKQLEAEGKEVNLPQHTLDLAYTTPLKNLTAQQLDAIHDELDALVTQGLKEMRDMQEARGVRIEETVDKLVEHMGIPPEDPAIITRETLKLGKWQKIVETIQSFTMRTYFVQNIFRMLDGMEEDGLMTRTFSHPAYQATNKELFDVIAHEDGLRAFMKDYGISPASILRVEKEFKTGIPLTSSTRMGAFLGARDHDARLHMEYGNKVTATEITELIDQMTPNEIALAEYLSTNFNDKARQLSISEVKELVEGKSLKIVEDWFPIRLLNEAEPSMEFPELLTWSSDQRMIARTATEPGMAAKFVKERSHRALQAIDLDALSIYLRYIKESAHYTAFAPLISDFRRITKHPKFRKAFKAKIGRPALEVVEQWIEDMARGQRLMPRNWAEKVLRTARVNAVTAILGWSLTVAPKQFPSFVSGMAEIGVIPAMHGLATNTSHPVETWELIKKVSPQMRMRVMERELSLMKLTKSLEKRITGRMTKRELFMIFTLLVDRYVVNSLWVGAYEDYLGKNPGELEAAEEHATSAIIRTQPFFNVKDTAELWRSGEISAALTIFTNQLNRYWNYYRFDIYGKARAGKIGFGTLVKRVLLAFIVPALMISIISRSRLPKDGEDVLTSLADMGLAVIPVGGHWLTAGWKGFYGDSGIVTTEVLDKIQQASYRISKEEWDKLALLMPELAGFVTGLPTVQPKRTIKAIIDLASGKSDDWLELIWGSYTREKARKEEREKGREVPSIIPEAEGGFSIEDLLK